MINFLITIAMFGVIVACAVPQTVSVPKTESVHPGNAKVEKSKQKTPISIPDEPKTLASIDPDTLKVTYAKGSDPKLVVEQLVKAWSTAMQNLQACQQSLQATQAKK